MEPALVALAGGDDRGVRGYGCTVVGAAIVVFHISGLLPRIRHPRVVQPGGGSPLFHRGARPRLAGMANPRLVAVYMLRYMLGRGLRGLPGDRGILDAHRRCRSMGVVCTHRGGYRCIRYHICARTAILVARPETGGKSVTVINVGRRPLGAVALGDRASRRDQAESTRYCKGGRANVHKKATTNRLG